MPRRSTVPTAEQRAVVDLFLTGEDLVVEAGAGCGKTSTLVRCAQWTNDHGTYLAFNRAIVDEARSKFPSNVECSTAHGMAFRAVGAQYAHRLNAPRVKANDVGAMLRITPWGCPGIGGLQRYFAVGKLVSLLNSAVDQFCVSADEDISERMIPYVDGIDMPTAEGKRTYTNNNALRAYLAPFLRALWSDITNTSGFSNFKHNHYLKIWALSHPRIHTNYVLFDEAQDANPLMIGIVAGQAEWDTQVVWVGDSQQAIYGWNGAVNALQQVPYKHRAFLTTSFRFGPAIADIANLVLTELDAELRLTGNPRMHSEVTEIERPDTVLYRTNAGAVGRLLEALESGTTVALVGGGNELTSFAKAAEDLQAGRGTIHPELSVFKTWIEVAEYVKLDRANAGTLATYFSVVDRYGARRLIEALLQQAPEEQAELVLSTAHKAKGREWSEVQLGADFPNPRDAEEGYVSPEEMRLLYVAVTRARHVLDATRSSFIEELTGPVLGAAVPEEITA